MRILITGANGFIGRVLIEHLQATHEIVPVTRTKISGISGISLDLSDETATERAIANGVFSPCDVIIHLASIVASPETIDDLAILFGNASIAKSISIIGKYIGVRKIIHVSSMAVYPNIDGRFTEQSTVNPSMNTDCVYGLSKYNAEVLLDYFFKKTQVAITHLRVAMVYGENMPANRIIPTMKKELREEGKITLFGNGERLINQIEVNKFAQVLKRFIDSDHKGVFNIGDELLSTEQLAEKINQGSRGQIVKMPQGNSSKFILDISKMRSI